MVHPNDNGGSIATRTLIRLAPGVRLIGDTPEAESVELVLAGGTVQLNHMAASILEWCDGSLSREAVVEAVISQPGTRAKRSDVREFLRAALARGWVIEGAHSSAR